MPFDDPIPIGDFQAPHSFGIVSSVSCIISYHIIVYHDKKSNVETLTISFIANLT